MNNPTAMAVTGTDKKDLNVESHQLLISKVFQLSAIMDKQLGTENV